jgi:hypothetical protein
MMALSAVEIKMRLLEKVAVGEGQRRNPRIAQITRIQMLPAKSIDPARLAMVAADAKLSAVAIAAEFDLPAPAFYAKLAHSERLAAIYSQGRLRAGVPIFSMRKLRVKAGRFSNDERSILDTIADGRRRMCEIVAVTGLEPNHAGALLYNLEHERHAVWTMREGLPPVTRYFLRAEEVNGEGKVVRRWRRRRRMSKDRRAKVKVVQAAVREIGGVRDRGTGRRGNRGTARSEVSPTLALAVSDSRAAVAQAADVDGLASEAEVWALDKLFVSLDWSAEGVEKFVYQRFQRQHYRSLSPAEANSLTMILLNVAAARAIKERGGAHRVSRTMIREEIPKLKQRLGIDDA